MRPKKRPNSLISLSNERRYAGKETHFVKQRALSFPSDDAIRGCCERIDIEKMMKFSNVVY